MNRELANIVRAALARIRSCKRHHESMNNGACSWCVVDSITKREWKSISEIMGGF